MSTELLISTKLPKEYLDALSSIIYEGQTDGEEKRVLWTLPATIVPHLQRNTILEL